MNRALILTALILALAGCVDPYEPEISESQEVVVINGVITDRPGRHRATVSMSSPYNEPGYRPCRGCVVTVKDESGTLRTYTETAPGEYDAWFGEDFLGVGKSYSMEVVTPDGNRYVSDYDTLLACPPIDSVYYEITSRGTSDPAVTRYGLQFYCDMEGTEGGARNFRWLLEETWEYTSPNTGTFIYFGGGGEKPLLKDTVYICYSVSRIPAVFAASSRSLSVNRIRGYPLNFVSDESPRLLIKYSLQVEQHSLSNQAYAYWEQMAAQSAADGGLYETQPSTARGNFYPAGDPSEEVLGCFYATQSRQKRIMVERDFEFFIPWYTCTLDTIQSVSQLGTLYPYYLISINPMGVGPPFLTGNRRCFDCREWGGTNVKPEYW